MSEAEILIELQRIFQEKFRVPAEKLVPEADLVADLNLDSLDRIELLFELETLLGVELEDADLKDVRTLGDMVQRGSTWLARSAEKPG